MFFPDDPPPSVDFSAEIVISFLHITGTISTQAIIREINLLVHDVRVIGLKADPGFPVIAIASPPPIHIVSVKKADIPSAARVELSTISCLIPEPS